MTPPQTCPATRPTNANQHPGRVGKHTRHTKVEMAEYRARLEQEKEAIRQRKKDGIASVARLEDQMAVDDANTRSAHPRSHSGDFHPSLFGVELIQGKISLKGQHIR